jgi:hypothetical protein
MDGLGVESSLRARKSVALAIGSHPDIVGKGLPTYGSPDDALRNSGTGRPTIRRAMGWRFGAGAQA